MIKIGTTISSLVNNSVRSVKALVLGKEDRRTFYESMPFGVDSVPIRGIKVVVAETSTREDKVVLGYINTNQKAESGDYRIYSLNDDGMVATDIWLKSDGTIEMGGDSDNMVRYSALEDAYNELQEKFNDLVTAFNQHVHATAAVGPPVVPTPVPGIIPAIESTGDIEPSKIDEIKTS